MQRHGPWLDRLERRAWRRNRAAFARLFAEEGDPRANPTFAALSPGQQARLAWLFDAWTCAPAGFLAGELPSQLAPEPPEAA